MNIVFLENDSRENLLPLSYTKPVVELRTGILKIIDKWKILIPDATFSYLTLPYLSKKFPLKTADTSTLIASNFIPGKSVVQAIMKLKSQQALYKGERFIACATENENLNDFPGEGIPENYQRIEYEESCKFLDYPWQIFSYNGEEIQNDFELLTEGRSGNTLSPTNNIIGNNIFTEEGAKAEYATINTDSGPVYIGKEAEIMEGSVIRGPFALCDHSVIKMASKIYGPTTIGPYSKVGGEINNCVFQSFSNKAHDGFLGNSVIGEWCNLGADTNNSNLKNNYAEVKLWNYPKGRFIKTGLQFCGLIMGDHSKCGINTMFNTGTVVGVNANIYGSGFPRNFIPSFSWGGAHGFTTYTQTRAFEVASLVMKRRGIEFDEKERAILEEVFRLTEKYRK